MIPNDKPDGALVFGRDLNRIHSALREQRLRSSNTVSVKTDPSGTIARVTPGGTSVTVSLMHPLRIYQVPGEALEPARSDSDSDWLKFRVRSARVGVVFENALTGSDLVPDPYDDTDVPDYTVGSATIWTLPSGVDRCWFWIQIGDGTATIRGDYRPVSQGGLIPDVVQMFTQIHPLYRPIGYVDTTDVTTNVAKVRQYLRSDIVGPMMRVCYEGESIPFPVPFS